MYHGRFTRDINRPVCLWLLVFPFYLVSGRIKSLETMKGSEPCHWITISRPYKALVTLELFGTIVLERWILVWKTIETLIVEVAKIRNFFSLYILILIMLLRVMFLWLVAPMTSWDKCSRWAKWERRWLAQGKWMRWNWHPGKMKLESGL